MSLKSIDCTSLMAQRSLPLMDVRSPVEFNSGHIPWAVNVPLFSDEERNEIEELKFSDGTRKEKKYYIEIKSGKWRPLDKLACQEINT